MLERREVMVAHLSDVPRVTRKGLPVHLRPCMHTHAHTKNYTFFFFFNRHLIWFVIDSQRQKTNCASHSGQACGFYYCGGGEGEGIEGFLSLREGRSYLRTHANANAHLPRALWSACRRSRSPFARAGRIGSTAWPGPRSSCGAAPPSCRSTCRRSSDRNAGSGAARRKKERISRRGGTNPTIPSIDHTDLALDEVKLGLALHTFWTLRKRKTGSG